MGLRQIPENPGYGLPVVADRAGNKEFHRGIKGRGDTDRLIGPGKDILGYPSMKGVAACGDKSDPSSPPGPTSVVLSAGSWGSAGNTTITGLTNSVKYVVRSGSTIKGVKANGTLGTGLADAADLTGTAITGLTNGTTYDVYKLVTGADSGTTSLVDTEYNTVVDISGLTNSQDHTIEAGASKPAAKYVVVYVGQALEATTGAVIATQEIEGATLDYTFGSTTADGAEFLDIAAGDEWIVLDFSALTDDSFTTAIGVKTAD
jgi:hypothetical protein